MSAIEQVAVPHITYYSERGTALGGALQILQAAYNTLNYVTPMHEASNL